MADSVELEPPEVGQYPIRQSIAKSYKRGEEGRVGCLWQTTNGRDLSVKFTRSTAFGRRVLQ